MITIAIANQKGGVGKTTTSVNLAAALIKYGRKVLLVDLDPQATATRFLLDRYGQDGTTIYDVLFQRISLPDCIQRSKAGIPIVPSNFRLAALDMDLNNELNRENRLAMVLEETPNYDYVLVDCPTHLGFANINAFAAAQKVLIPIECAPEAWEAVPYLMETLRKIIKQLNHPLRVYALPTFLDRTNIAKDIHEEIIKHFESYTLSPITSKHRHQKVSISRSRLRRILIEEPTRWTVTPFPGGCFRAPQKSCMTRSICERAEPSIRYARSRLSAARSCAGQASGAQYVSFAHQASDRYRFGRAPIRDWEQRRSNL